MKPRSAALASSLLFLAFFQIFIRTFCASVYCDDSGETATLAWTLSIGHPPGYPFHTLLAHVFSLLPLGDPGLRVSLFAAFLGALCAALVFWACDSRPRGLVAACLLCLGPVFWHNAGTAKGSVYMLNNVLSLACLWAAGSQRQRFFWVLLGLGLANHYMSQLVLLPCYLLLMREAGWRKAWGGAWLALPGISLYLYLPLRAAQDPAINWSHIQSLGGFVFYFLRAQYAAGEFSRAAGTSLGQLIAAIKDVLLEGHGIACLLAFYALWQAWLARDSRRLALALGAATALLAVALYLNLGSSRLGLMQPYLFPAYLCVALLAAAALEQLKAWSLPLWIALALLPAVQGWSRQDKSDYYFAADSARNILASLPQNAALFSAGDAVIFPIWYLQKVKHERPDVALIGNPVLPMDWVREGLKRDYPSLRQPRVWGAIGAESVDRLVYGFLELNQGQRPLYFSYNKMNTGIPWTLCPQGPVYLALPPKAPAPKGFAQAARARLQACVTRGYGRPGLDTRTQSLVVNDFAVHHNALANYLEGAKDYAGALEEYRQAAALNPKDEEFPYNCGNALYEMGRYAEAPAFYQRCLALNSRYADAWFNLALSESKLGQAQDACFALRKVLEIDPSRKEVLPYLAKCSNPQ